MSIYKTTAQYKKVPCSENLINHGEQRPKVEAEHGKYALWIQSPMFIQGTCGKDKKSIFVGEMHTDHLEMQIGHKQYGKLFLSRTTALY